MACLIFSVYLDLLNYKIIKYNKNYNNTRLIPAGKNPTGNLLLMRLKFVDLNIFIFQSLTQKSQVTLDFQDYRQLPQKYQLVFLPWQGS